MCCGGGSNRGTTIIAMPWSRLVATHGVIGSQVYDARLVAAMMVHTVRRILTFGRKQPATRQSLHLGPVVQEALSLLRALVPTNVTVEVA